MSSIIKEKFREYARIIRVAKKPSFYEFKTILKITGLGVILIGFIGFTIQLIARLIK